jgi:DNA topoisomerase-1
MEKAIFENTDVEFLIKDEPFTTKGKIKKYDGWMAVYPFEKKKEQTLPQLSKGESVTINKVSTKKSQTKPPKKITEAELLSLMDKNNIGTKSTAPAHIETNKTR